MKQSNWRDRSSGPIRTYGKRRHPKPSPYSRSRALSLLVVAGFAIACAHAVPPTGGEVPDYPPRLVESRPEPLTIVPAWDGYVSFRFDRTLSEQGLEDIAFVSPETGEVKLRRSGSELRVSIEGGWRSDQIYRVELQSGIQDRYSNVRNEAIELVFSTGPPLVNTAAAGVVEDRITVEPISLARVEAHHTDEEMTYVAMTDSAGFFTFRHIPEGFYQLRAYEDRNRNTEVDPFEPIDTDTVRLVEGDTAAFSFAPLVPDTAPAQLTAAEAMDSLHIQLTFDDYLDPFRPLEGVEAVLVTLPDSTPVEVAEVIYAHEFEARQQEIAAAEVAEADTVPPDSAATDPPVIDLPPEQVEGTPEEPDKGPLPLRELVVIPASPLEPVSRYRIEVRGVTNIADIPGGGGRVDIETPPRPEPEPEPTPDPPGPPDPDSTATAVPPG